eukprot:Hpha_TRINITY_DN11011_c0_g1::TRINITY_DN11011_c0_g1_i1::g.92642::m.92642
MLASMLSAPGRGGTNGKRQSEAAVVQRKSNKLKELFRAKLLTNTCEGLAAAGRTHYMKRATGIDAGAGPNRFFLRPSSAPPNRAAVAAVATRRYVSKVDAKEADATQRPVRREKLRRVGHCLQGRPVLRHAPKTAEGWELFGREGGSTRDEDSLHLNTTFGTTVLDRTVSGNLSTEGSWGERRPLTPQETSMPLTIPHSPPRAAASRRKGKAAAYRESVLRCRGAADAGGMKVSVARRALAGGAGEGRRCTYWKQLTTAEEQEREWAIHQHLLHKCDNLSFVHACIGRHERYMSRGEASQAFQYVPFLEFLPHDTTIAEALSGQLKPSMVRIRWWLLCVAQQLEALHRSGVAHNALMPGAIVLVKAGSGDSRLVLGDDYDDVVPKLSEFCCATIFDGHPPPLVTANPRPSVDLAVRAPPAKMPDTLRCWGHAPEVDAGWEEEEELDVTSARTLRSAAASLEPAPTRLPGVPSSPLRRVASRQSQSEGSPLREGSQRGGSPTRGGSPARGGSPSESPRRKQSAFDSSPRAVKSPIRKRRPKKRVEQTGPGACSDIYLFGLLLRWVVNMGSHRGIFGDQVQLAQAERRRRRELTRPEQGFVSVDDVAVALAVSPELQQACATHRYNGVS